MKKTRCAGTLGGLVLICVLASCGSREYDRQKAMLNEMVSRNASKADVVASLGSSVVSYSKTGTNWDALVLYLAREPTNRLIEVRDKSASWPHVVCYSTPDIVAWVFLDDRERAVDYVLSAQ